MSTISSVIALIGTLVAALAFIFVFSGTEQIRLDWVAMDNDYSEVEFANLINPPRDTTSYAATSSTPDPMPVASGVDYVLWINISGLRGDYVEKSSTPFFDQISSRGSVTNELAPVFPTLEFPNLITQATGVGIDVHGVPSNNFRDPETKEVIERPTRLSLLKAEPIWTTAKRQGRAVLVHDWPFSQEQPAEHASGLFLPEYDASRSDEDRLNALFDAWTSYQGESKLRLLMANLKDIDKAGRSFGSRETDTFEAVSKLDATLQAFFEKLRAKWPELSDPGDTLNVFLTTDHGMTDVDKVIHFGHLMGEFATQVDYAVDDAVAHIWFKDPPAGVTMEKFQEKYDYELNARIFWRFYKPGDYPSTFGFGDGGPQFGDRFLVLKSGYSFTTEKGSEPVYPPSEVGGPFAISGYSVRDNSRMAGQAFFFQLEGGSGSNLGRVEAAQLYPTVCKLLEIEPAPGASTESLTVN